MRRLVAARPAVSGDTAADGRLKRSPKRAGLPLIVVADRILRFSKR